MQGVVGGLITACHTHPFLFNLSRSLSEDKVAHSKSPQNLTQDRLKELLHYDPETGIFTWRVARGSAKVGDVAGVIDTEGYRLIWLDNCQFRAPRVAFFYVIGVWPTETIDHINGVRDDDRWLNLREATREENSHNRGVPPINNSSGFIGTGWNKSHSKWEARIRAGGKLHHLGYFATPKAAHAAYLKAKNELHPTHRRLRSAA